MRRFFILFMLLLLALFTIQVLKPVQDHVILPFTAGLAHVSVGIIELFDANVESAGKVLRSTANGFAVSIEPGCNGVEAMIILFSAMFAFPAPWKHKIVGFLVGSLAIQALNTVRIISLFYLGQWNFVWFEWFHLYLWPAMLILEALAFFLLWLRWLPPIRRDPPGGAVAAPA